jgi:hypothetical protein
MIGNGAGERPLGRDRTLEGRRGVDLAEGILIGLRRYRTRAAFAELVDVALRHGSSVSALASALVGLAIGDIDAAQFHSGRDVGRTPAVERPTDPQPRRVYDHILGQPSSVDIRE